MQGAVKARKKVCDFCGMEFISTSPVVKCCGPICALLKSQRRAREYYHNHKEKRSLDNKKWQKENAQYMSKKRKTARLKNPQKYKEQFKKWYDKNHDRQLRRAQEYKKNNPDKVKESFKKWSKQKIKNDINYRLLIRLRNRIKNSIRRSNGRKAFSVVELTGCTVAQLKKHLEKQFQPGMTFENYGKWHIDHIIPCASFDLSDPQQQKRCFHYTNLQPLWAIENIKKGANIA